MNMISVIAAFATAAFLFLPPEAPAADQAPSGRERLSAVHEVSSSDVEEEVRFGREVAARIIGRYSIYENNALLRYVTLVGQSLVMSTNRPELEYHFAILNTEEINAYAAPGGYVFVTRGAIQKMQNEAELAGVLAHEIAHVAERHIVRELNIRGADNSVTSGLAHAIGGSTDAARVAFTQAIDKAVDILFKNGYKREDETQADKDSVMFCALSGYEPTGLVRYFERIDAVKGKQTSVLDKTHPSYETRISLLKNTISQEGLESKEFKINKKRFDENVKDLK